LALGARIHAFARSQAMVASTEKPKSKAWMPAPSASMTTESGRSNALGYRIHSTGQQCKCGHDGGVFGNIERGRHRADQSVIAMFFSTVCDSISSSTL